MVNGALQQPLAYGHPAVFARLTYATDVDVADHSNSAGDLLKTRIRRGVLFPHHSGCAPLDVVQGPSTGTRFGERVSSRR